MYAILEKLIDVRLFGATMPIKLEGKGQSIAFTGPVQFNWGYSLNKVYLLDSQSITSHFSSGETQEQGTIGKDYRVKYSLIAFHGVISGYNAKNTNLKEEDIALLDEAIVKAIPLHATRSKVGQEPRLYLRVEYNSDGFILGDFRKWVKLVKVNNKKDEELFSVKDIQLDISQLIDELKNVQEQIAQVYVWHDKNLKLIGNIDELPGLIKMWKGMFAHFRQFDANSSSLSYSFPPPTVITGMIAGLFGIERDEYYKLFGKRFLELTVQLLTPPRFSARTGYLPSVSEIY